MIEKNNKRIVKRICNDSDFNSSLTTREQLSIKTIYNLAKTIDIKKIKPIFANSMRLSTAYFRLTNAKRLKLVQIGRDTLERLKTFYCMLVLQINSML